MLHQPVLDYPVRLLLKLRLGVLSQLLKVVAPYVRCVQRNMQRDTKSKLRRFGY